MPNPTLASFEPLFTARARRVALGVDGAGRAHIARVSCTGDAHILRVEPLDAAIDGESDDALIHPAGMICDVALSADADGRLLAVWTQIGLGGSRLWWAVRVAPGRWSAPTELTTLFGSQLAPVLARDVKGRPWLAFHTNTTSKHHVFLTWFASGLWAFPQRVSDGDGHCFAPSLCRFGEGIRIVWDGRIDGRFGLYMREFDTDVDLDDWEPQATVAQGATFAGNATILAMDAESSLIVYERGNALWSRTQTSGTRRAQLPAGPMHGVTRELVGVRIGPDGQAPLARSIDPQLDVGGKVNRVGPKLAADLHERIWLTWRQIDPDRIGKGGPSYVQAVSYCTGNSWSQPVVLPDSLGDSETSAALVAEPSGRMLLAYTGCQKGAYHIRVAGLSAGSSKPARASGSKWRPMDLTDPQKAVRPRLITTDGQFGSPRLFWGDIHRHSDISGCKAWVEGSPAEAYRYALSAADLDFFALTEHACYLQTPDTRAEVFALAGAMNLPGVFTTFAAYEANFLPGQGHAVVLTDRDNPRVPSEKSRKAVFKQLVETGGATVIPHHVGDPDYPYAWAGHDDQLGPVAEIYQPYRTSFECVDAPAPPSVLPRKDYRVVEQSTLQAAWAAGHKLGVTASSDHLGLAPALTGVWTAVNNRASILDALRQRRCYAATARIELAFWAGEHFMGESFELTEAAQVTFRLRCLGADRIRSVELIRDGQTVHTFTPAGKHGTKIAARKKLPVPVGRHYFYLRVTQADGNMAWSSPVWIRVGRR